MEDLMVYSPFWEEEHVVDSDQNTGESWSCGYASQMASGAGNMSSIWAT